MKLNLEAKRFVIFGLQGSGKTVLGRHLTSYFKQHAVFDTTGHDFNPKRFERYVPKIKGDHMELNDFVEWCIKKKKRMIFIDEMNRYCPSKKPLPRMIEVLNDESRHFYNMKGITFGGIARRPQQLNTDLVELAHYLFIFVLKGKNDVKYFNDISNGLGDTVASLPDFHFVVVDQNRNFEVHNPVELIE